MSQGGRCRLDSKGERQVTNFHRSRRKRVMGERDEVEEKGFTWKWKRCGFGSVIVEVKVKAGASSIMEAADGF